MLYLAVVMLCPETDSLLSGPFFTVSMKLIPSWIRRTNVQDMSNFQPPYPQVYTLLCPWA